MSEIIVKEAKQFSFTITAPSGNVYSFTMNNQETEEQAVLLIINDLKSVIKSFEDTLV